MSLVFKEIIHLFNLNYKVKLLRIVVIEHEPPSAVFSMNGLEMAQKCCLNISITSLYLRSSSIYCIVTNGQHTEKNKFCRNNTRWL